MVQPWYLQIVFPYIHYMERKKQRYKTDIAWEFHQSKKPTTLNGSIETYICLTWSGFLGRLSPIVAILFIFITLFVAQTNFFALIRLNLRKNWITKFRAHDILLVHSSSFTFVMLRIEIHLVVDTFKSNFSFASQLWRRHPSN